VSGVLAQVLLVHALRQALLGALAAAGFGVLFNAAPRALAFCAAGGGLALAVRTVTGDLGWSLEAASFAAAVTVTVLAAGPLHRWLGSGATAVAVAACIPMVPGAFFARSLLGLFAMTAPDAAGTDPAFAATVIAMVRVVFTLGGIGAGIAIPLTVLGRREL
jgi:uncharacterized membrane protein YjjB (DUF3815 family)